MSGRGGGVACLQASSPLAGSKIIFLVLKMLPNVKEDGHIKIKLRNT